MMLTSIVSEESLAKDKHTDNHTINRHGLVYVNFFKVTKTLKTNTKFRAWSLLP